MRLLSFGWIAAIGMMWIVGCGDEKRKDPPCRDDAQCGEGLVCANQTCADPADATVQASIEAAGKGGAVSLLDGEGNVCEGGQCRGLPYGSRVTFRAEKVPGARFTGWSGSPECRGDTPDLTIEKLTRDVHCVATFVTRLRVSGEVVGVEGGGVTATAESPDATCSGNSCEVDANTKVRLEAMMRWGERFVGWSGAGCSDGRTASRVIEVTARDSNIACTATFQPRITIGGKAMGVEAVIEVSSSGAFAVCEPGSCLIDRGASGLLQAPDVPGFRFAGWSGTESCTGDNPRLVIENATASELCLATYLRRFTVSGTAAGATPPPDVSAVSKDQYATCMGGSCQVDNHGSVTLIAWSTPGFRLERWSGPGCGMESGAALEVEDVTADLACTANYVPGIAVMGVVVGAPADVKASSTTPGASCSGGGCILPPNGNVTLEAPTIEGYRFQRWKGEPGCEGSDLTLRFMQVTQSKTCEAEYYTRYVVRGLGAPRDGGTIVATSANVGAACRENACTLDAGGEVRLEAKAADGFRFSGWSGGGACTGNTPAIAVRDIKANVSCQANFVLRAAVTGVASPTNGGSVRAYSDSGAAQCNGNTCLVDEGSRVDLMAVPATGYRFSGWSECSDARTENLRIEDVQRPVMCRANFEPLRFTIASSIAPANAGTVTAFSAASSADCRGGMCTVNFGSEVRLTANAATGFRFVNWSGCSTSRAQTLELENVRASANCQANFTRIIISATAIADPDEGGDVTARSNTQGATCSGARCTLPYGGNATLSATPARGYRFAGWSGCGSGTQQMLSLMNVTSAVECRANFELTRWSVTGVASPANAGTIAASTPSNGTCRDGRCSVDFGASVTLEARDNAGFRFSGWTGCRTSSERRVTFENVASDISCTANYERIRVMVSGAPAAPNTGSVRAMSTAAGAQCSNGSCTVNVGESVNLTAVETPEFAFSGWTSCPVTGGLTIPISNVTANVTCTANFTRRTFMVTGEPGVGGSVVGVGDGCTGRVCTVPFGGTATFTAMPMAGFRFAGWTGCAPANMPTASISNVTMNATCAAMFQGQITVEVERGTGQGTVETSCGMASCTVDMGQTVRLTAKPATAEGFEFEGWEGPGCVPASAATIDVARSTTCVANFRQLKRTVTANVDPTGGGTVALSCEGTPCPGTGMTRTVDSGTVVRFVADENEGFTWSGWTCSVAPANAMSREITLTANTNLTCTAKFTPIVMRQITLTVASGMGTVAARCGTAACPASGVADGTSVRLEATPHGNYDFDQWTCTSPARTSDMAAFSLEANRDITCAASFRLKRYDVEATKQGQGEVEITCSTASCATVEHGTVVTFVATAASGWTFMGWSGCTTADTRTIMQTAGSASSVRCRATFVQNAPEMFTVRAVAGTGGSIGPCDRDSCQEVVEAGEDSRAFTARPDDGFEFAGWDLQACGTSATLTFMNVTTNRTCTASFTPLATEDAGVLMRP